MKNNSNIRRRRIKGSIIAFLGYLLSPLAWWNDLILNIPIAYVIALPFKLLSEKLFLPAMILGYWITNIVGFIMIHYGVGHAVSKKQRKYSKKELIKDLTISILYTGIIVVMVLMGWLKPPTEYFN
ncbi:MAG: hypothetical protein VX798_10005 [Bacteroidota bacterium]|uniref:DUF2062 domain-containing protein n=1 Tax=Flagellimonas profundi TaxID=2915620 RepID=A0ABS3FC63_9FLAO|nr:hypothetical protein [Allomuricauda profundi]MBO0340300.1 hypothetical protein [Allomuricauda profundi]MEC7771508.1 hypothetical protein [Bacteroidota bacterium]